MSTASIKPQPPERYEFRPFHLARRFFGVLFARRLSSEELAWVASRLPEPLWELFISQQVADQRHGLEAGRRIVAAGVDDNDLVTAALLHDVGKRHSHLGAVARSVATLLIVLRLPMTARMRQYRDHGKLGAVDLTEAGAPEVVVSFARYHQFGRPVDMTVETWNALRSADMSS